LKRQILFIILVIMAIVTMLMISPLVVLFVEV